MVSNTKGLEVSEKVLKPNLTQQASRDIDFCYKPKPSIPASPLTLPQMAWLVFIFP